MTQRGVGCTDASLYRPTFRSLALKALFECLKRISSDA